jgi:hypothetical protein
MRRQTPPPRAGSPAPAIERSVNRYVWAAGETSGASLRDMLVMLAAAARLALSSRCLDDRTQALLTVFWPSR